MAILPLGQLQIQGDTPGLYHRNRFLDSLSSVCLFGYVELRDWRCCSPDFAFHFQIRDTSQLDHRWPFGEKGDFAVDGRSSEPERW